MNETVNPCTEEVQEEVTVEELQEKLKHTEAERDEAQNKATATRFALRAAQNTIFALEREKERDRKVYRAKIKYYACQRMRSLTLPAFLLILFAAFAIGVMVAMDHALIVPALGEVVTVAAIVGATFCCGLIYERVRK